MTTTGVTSVQVSPRVGWVHSRVDPPEVVVAALPSGPPLVLTGSAAAIWLEAVTQPSLPDLIEAVRSRVVDPPDHLDDDVRRFLDDLAASGLIALSSDGAPDPEGGPPGR